MNGRRMCSGPGLVILALFRERFVTCRWITFFLLMGTIIILLAFEGYASADTFITVTENDSPESFTVNIFGPNFPSETQNIPGENGFAFLNGPPNRPDVTFLDIRTDTITEPGSNVASDVIAIRFFLAPDQTTYEAFIGACSDPSVDEPNTVCASTLNFQEEQIAGNHYTYDANGIGRVNVTFQTNPDLEPPPPTSTPEPATLGLFLTGLGGLGWWRYRARMQVV